MASSAFARSIMCLALFASQGCRKRPPRAAPRDAQTVVIDAPEPHEAREAAVLADVSLPRVLGRDELAPLFAAGAEAPIGAVELAASREGAVAAWLDGAGVRARLLRGGRWEAMGDRVNDRAPQGPVRVARAPDGAAVIVWSERGRAGPTETRYAQWDGREWVMFPGPLNAPEAHSGIASVAVTWSYGLPVVAMVVTRDDRPESSLRVMRWTGARWDLAGPPSLIDPSSRVQTLAATSCGDGSAVLGWVEVLATGTPTLELRRWSTQSRNWRVVPRGALPLVDAGTRELALAGASGAELFIAYGWSGGTHPVMRWNESALEWSELGLPLPSLRATQLESGPYLDAQGEVPWMTWRAPSGRLSTARLRSRNWEMVSDSLDAAGSALARVALAPEGTLYAASRAPSGRVTLLSFGVE